MRKILLPGILFFVLFAVFAAPVRAEVPPPSTAALQAVTRARYPDADAVLVHDLHRVVYQPDGQYVETDDYYYKILTDKGRREYREMSFYFNPVYGTVRIEVAERIRPDGAVVAVDIAANSKETIDSSQMGSNIYDPNNKRLKLAIPGLEIGDTLRIRVAEKLVKPRIPDVWCSIFALQSNVPVLKYIVEVDAPTERPLAVKIIKDEAPGTVAYSETRAGGRTVHRWEATDVPQLFPEPDMPPMYMYAQRLLLSTAPGWPDISRWYYRLCRPRLDAVTPEMKEKVAELTKHTDTPRAKVEALFQFVSQNIRYMGITPEEEAPGYEPHDVSLTFNNRYGVCRDKAALLVSMLELAGIKAYPVLFMAGPKKDAEVPNNYFNHAIVAAELTSGEYALMDPTVETTTVLLDAGLANMSYLVAKPDGDSLRTSPIVPATENMLVITGRGAVDRSGRLEYAATFDFTGFNDSAYRSAFSRWPEEYRRQFVAGVLKRAVPGAELQDLRLTPEDVRDMSAPLRLELRFTATIPTGGPGREFPFSPPFLSEHFGLASQLLGSTGLETRRFPMRIYSTCGVRENFALELPPEFGSPAAPPEAVSIDTPAYSFARRYRLDGGKLAGSQEIMVKLPEISPEAYRELKAAQQRTEIAKRACPLLRPAAPAVNYDAAYRHLDTVIRVEAPGRWSSEETVALTIRNYAGVKRFSELKFHYNPVWETVEVDDVLVIAPDGTKHTVTAKEINRMDAAWAGAAPRYPAGKVLVVNLPGVAPGAQLSYTVKRTCFDRPFFSHHAVFAHHYPVARQRLAIQAAPELKLRFSEPSPEIRRDGDRFERTDIAATPDEFGAPPLYFSESAVAVSNGDLKGFAAEVRRALTAAAAEQPRAAAKARELVFGAKHRAQKITAIRDFVAKNIRAAGPAFHALPLSALTPADRTLDDGYGNSADRAILLYAMLQAVDIPAEFLLTSPLTWHRAAGDRLVNFPENLYGEVILKLGGEEDTIYLNTGSEYADLGAARCEDQYALTLAGRASDPDRLEKIRPKNATLAGDLFFDIALDAQGTATIRIEERHHGRNFEAMNRRFAEFTPETRRRAFQEMVAAVAQNAEAVGEPEADFSTHPGVVRYTVKVPDFAVEVADYRTAALPGLARLAGLVNTADSRRQTPFFRAAPLRSRVEGRITLPEEYGEVILPESSILAAGIDDRVELRFQRKGRLVEFQADLNLGVALVPPAEYDRLVWMQSRLQALPQRMLIVKARP